MSLLQKVVDQVSVEARQKGVRCRGRGEVRLLAPQPNVIEAVVKCDGEPVAVRLRGEGPIVFYQCGCDEFDANGQPCQHVWATLLMAEAQEMLDEFDHAPRISLMPAVDEEITVVPDAMEDDAGDFPDDPDEADDEIGFGEDQTIEANDIERFSRFLEKQLTHRGPSANAGLAIASSPFGQHSKKQQKKKPPVDDWRSRFETLRSTIAQPETDHQPWPINRRLLYVIDLADAIRGPYLFVETMGQDRRKDGEWGKAKAESISAEDSNRFADPVDGQIVAALCGGGYDNYGYYYAGSHLRSSRFRIQDAQYASLIPQICQTGRARLRERPQTDYLTPLSWDERLWEFWLVGSRDEAAGRFVLSGELRSGDDRMPLSVPLALVQGGLLITQSHIARLDHGNAFGWINLLRRQPEITAPLTAGDELLAQILTMPQVPRLDLPPELTVERIAIAPKARLHVKKPPAKSSYYTKPKLIGVLSFDYDGQIIPHDQRGPAIYQSDRRRMIMRDREAERAALGRLRELGFREPRPSYYHREEEDQNRLELAPSHLPSVIRALLQENWFVEADGQLYRQAGEFKMELSSGIDWFELHGAVDFDGQTVALPELLKALRRGERTIRLDDGTFGVLPEQWLQKYGLLANMGDEQSDHVRFNKSQIGLLDAMLLAQPEISCDAVFESARKQLRDFSGVRDVEAPPTFVGTLRPYQREGLGWLGFLRQFRFGGCLADDMGLGKTVQVLALLEQRRLLREQQAPPTKGDTALASRPCPPAEDHSRDGCATTNAAACLPSPGTPGEGQGEGLPSSDRSQDPSPQPSSGVPGEGAKTPSAIALSIGASDNGNGNGAAHPGAADALTAAKAVHDDASNNGNGIGANRQDNPASDAPAPARIGPSLVIAPRSLVFNWRDEANRFAPGLRVLDHTGIGRDRTAKAFDNYDLILTTYGTLRNDITFMKDVPFDYVVLDEAQAIKNAASESAKACRLLGGAQRLALSGTPVQNHLGELWSLFEFLNPGMLGSAKAFQAGGAGARVVDEGARVLLSRALRPFILRRTKAQVAQDLPQRLEQTIHCELDVAQRKLYNDLKEHYRQSLLGRIAREGIAKNKIQVLEALLRLRQAACHPGLIDKAKTGQSSAKLDALLPQLSEVTDGGHKALVFSQFTSMLAIVRDRLDKEKIPYAYLDGRTRNRQEVVEHFQKDDNCRLFLISLKAGGIGLNLTAAEYVFLLDPWWNPAVEAQAIDRAHRIGQTHQVFAYRLIAKDTVEEKVLQLQNTKRELADAIINADNSVISKLGKEDLELLLS